MKHSLIAAMGCLFLCGAVVVSAQSPTALGSELLVNSHTVGQQLTPDVELASNGSFVVSWTGFDGGGYGVFARRFTATGLAQGLEFQVNVHTPGDQNKSRIGVENNGDFVIAWQSNGQDGGSEAIVARRFAAAGTPLAVEFIVNTYTSGSQNFPQMAVDADGDFVVVWQSYLQDSSSLGIFGRRFDSAGAALANEFQVNTYTTSIQQYPTIASEPSGNFIVAWESHRDGAGGGIFARLFISAGVGGPEFMINSYTQESQTYPTVDRDSTGRFVIAWQGAKGGVSGIFARRFNAAGAAQGPEFQAALNTLGVGVARPEVAIGDDGDFVVTWATISAEDVFSRAFTSAGTPATGDVLVNTYTVGAQGLPSIGTNGNGAFVIAWASAEQDGDAAGVFAQRFAAVAILDVDGNGEITALTDGLLILRFLFGFTGTTLTAGATGPGCLRCDSEAIVPYLTGLT